MSCPAWHPSLYNQPFVNDGNVQRRRRATPQAELPSCLSSSSCLFQSTEQWTTLHDLCASDHRGALDLYLRKRRPEFDDDLMQLDASGSTPLHIACTLDHFQVVSTLLHNVPSMTIEERANFEEIEYSAMCTALQHDSWWALQELVVRKANETGSNGSMTGRKVSVVTELLPQRWIDVLLAFRWSMGRALAGKCPTAPGVAAHSGRLLWPSYLLCITEEDDALLTLLHIAAAEPSLHRLAIILCRCCTTLCSAATARGCVPMHIGAQTTNPVGDNEFLHALLRGDELGRACMSANESDHSTLPVHVVARYSFDGDEVVAWLSKTVYALRHDEHITGVVDGNGWTVLHHACYSMAVTGDARHFPKVKQLVRSWGASLDTPSEGGTNDSERITPRRLVERSPYAAILLPLLDSLVDFCESFDF
jgi:ankyrin repeat protein